MSTTVQPSHPSPATLCLYYDGEGAQELRAGVEQHVAACSVCRAELQRLQSLTQELSSAPDLRAPARILEGVRAALAGPSRPAAEFKPMSRRASAAAAVLFLGLFGATWWVMEAALSPGRELARSRGTDPAGDAKAPPGEPGTEPDMLTKLDPHEPAGRSQETRARDAEIRKLGALAETVDPEMEDPGTKKSRTRQSRTENLDPESPTVALPAPAWCLTVRVPDASPERVAALVRILNASLATKPAAPEPSAPVEPWFLRSPGSAEAAPVRDPGILTPHRLSIPDGKLPALIGAARFWEQDLGYPARPAAAADEFLGIPIRMFATRPGETGRSSPFDVTPDVTPDATGAGAQSGAEVERRRRETLAPADLRVGLIVIPVPPENPAASRGERR